MKTVGQLKKVDFPKCYEECGFVALMGVSECESACPEKFGLVEAESAGIFSQEDMNSIHEKYCQEY